MEAIQAGAALLDEKAPEWRGKLTGKEDELNVADPLHCVLAFVYGDYFEGTRQLNLSPEQAIAHGFYYYGSFAREQYAELTENWKEVIYGN